MLVTSDTAVYASLLDELACAGFLSRRPPSSGDAPERWEVSGGMSQGYVHRDGNRYWAVDLAGMLPLYQEVYAHIFAERLRRGGVTERAGAAILRAGDLLLIWGPDAFMRAHSPSANARERIFVADHAWIQEVEHEWRRAVNALEQVVDLFWEGLHRGTVTAAGLRELIERKVLLNALAVDSLMPAVEKAERWLSPYVDPALLPEILDGCYQPASGFVAFDALEMECWRLARSHQTPEGLTDTARAQFIVAGLFFLYEALNTDRKAYFFSTYPGEVAVRYSRVALGSAALEARMKDVEHRAWRRRYHHHWARQQIEQVQGDRAVRDRLLALHRFAGTARDYDETKRRLNMKLWRALFALADSLGISLTSSGATIEHLCAAIERQGGYTTIDATFHAA